MRYRLNSGKAGRSAIICLSLILLVILKTPVFGEVRAKFRAGPDARSVILRGVDAVSLDHANASASAEFRLKKGSEGALWIRLFFPWIKNQAVHVTLNSLQGVTVTGLNRGGLWNSGNIDVWHWVPVYRGRLHAGKQTVIVDVSAGKGAGVESVIWTESQTPWMESWLTGPEISGAITNSWRSPLYPEDDDTGKSLIIEAAKGIYKQEQLKKDDVCLDSNPDFLAVPFRLFKRFKGDVWVRIFMGWKNNYEGWTLDELANAAYLFLDGELKQTIWGEDGYHWRWYRIENIELDSGLHLFTLRKRGSHVATDKLVLYSGQDFRKEHWFSVGPAVEPDEDSFFQNKGYPGYNGPMRIVSRFATGFGVPGGGYPRFLDKNLLLLPGGEGTVTVVDISNSRQPKIHDYCLNWYFNHALFPFRDGFYVNSSHRGVCYVEGAVDKGQPVRFRKVEMDCARYGRIGAVFQDSRPLPVAITKGGRDGAAIVDISQPLYPFVIGTVKNYTEKDFLLSQGRESGAAIDGDGNLGIIDLREPQKAFYKTLFSVPHELIQKKRRYARLVGLSRNFIFLRLGSKIELFRRTDAVNAAPSGIINLEKSAGSFVRAYEYGGLIHVIDGVRGPGQYSINYKSRHSTWYVYRPENLSKPLFVYEDPSPTAYSYTVFRSGKAYVFDYNYGLWIFDLSNPERPAKIGGISTSGEGHYLHLLDNDILCLSQTFGGTITMMDVRNPLHPKRIGQFWDGSWFSYDTASHTDLMTGKGTVLYFPKQHKGIQIIDFQEPGKPEMLGFIRGGKCRVVGNRLYTIYGNELLLYDISNERQPRLAGKLNTGQHNMSMAIDHPKSVWLTDLHRILAVDVSNGKGLGIAGRWESPEKKRFWGGIFHHRGYLFGACGDSWRTREIVTIDVKDPAQMKMIGTKKWQPQDLHTKVNDIWANFYRGDFLLYGKYLIASNYSRVELYDFSNPLDPKPIQLLNTGFQWSAGKIKNGHLFVPTLSGLVVVKLPCSH